MPDIFLIDCHAEAARCLTLAHACSDPYVRRGLTKIAESYGKLAEWLDTELESGRRAAMLDEQQAE